VVGTGAFDFSSAVLYASPEVASAYDYSYFDAELYDCSDRLANALNNVKVQSGLFFAGQRFSADFEQYSFIFGFFSGQSAHLQL